MKIRAALAMWMITLTAACPDPAGLDAGEGGDAAPGADVRGAADSAVGSDRRGGDAVGPDSTSRDATAPDATSGDAGSADVSRGDSATIDPTPYDGGYALAQLLGTVEVVERHPLGGAQLASASAAIYDRPSPDIAPEAWYTVVEENGFCELRQAAFMGDIPWCEPWCDPGFFCTPAETCEPQPELAPAGTIDIEGLSQGVSLTTSVGGNYEWFSSFPGDDAFGTGANIAVTAAGGDTEAFTLEVRGVSDLTGVSPESWVITEGQDLEVSWTPAAAGGAVEVYLTPVVHAGIWLYIRCRVSDSGHLSIPWSMLQTFPYDDECTHGHCGAHCRISRFDEAHADLENGVIRLRVESRVDVPLARPRP